MQGWKEFSGVFLTVVLLVWVSDAPAQTDSTKRMSMDSILRNQKGIITLLRIY
jgi:hypothetical protein